MKTFDTRDEKNVVDIVVDNFAKFNLIKRNILIENAISQRLKEHISGHPESV